MEDEKYYGGRLEGGNEMTTQERIEAIKALTILLQTQISGDLYSKIQKKLDSLIGGL